eukprot:COSAG01_NODE_10043_length_2263_cov_1.897921_2_plen_196_part_00
MRRDSHLPAWRRSHAAGGTRRRRRTCRRSSCAAGATMHHRLSIVCAAYTPPGPARHALLSSIIPRTLSEKRRPLISTSDWERRTGEPLSPTGLCAPPAPSPSSPPPRRRLRWHGQRGRHRCTDDSLHVQRSLPVYLVPCDTMITVNGGQLGINTRASHTDWTAKPRVMSICARNASASTHPTCAAHSPRCAGPGA